MAEKNHPPLGASGQDGYPVHPNPSVGSSNNTGTGTQKISDGKNTGDKAGDGSGASNPTHTGSVSNNYGMQNVGTQNIRGLINNMGITNGNGNGCLNLGGGRF